MPISVFIWKKEKVAQSCPTLCNPMDYTVHGILQARILGPWNSPGKNTEVGCHSLLHGIFSTQGSNPLPLHWQTDSFPLHHHQLYVSVCPLPLKPPSAHPSPLLGHHRLPSWAPCAIRQLPASSLTRGSVCVPTLIFQFAPPSLSTTVPSSYPHTHPLELPWRLKSKRESYHMLMHLCGI